MATHQFEQYCLGVFYRLLFKQYGITEKLNSSNAGEVLMVILLNRPDSSTLRAEFAGHDNWQALVNYIYRREGISLTNSLTDGPWEALVKVSFAFAGLPDLPYDALEAGQLTNSQIADKIGDPLRLIEVVNGYPQLRDSAAQSRFRTVLSGVALRSERLKATALM